MISQTNVEKLFYESYLSQSPDSVRLNIALQDASITKNSIYIIGIVEDNGFKFVVGEVDVAPSNQTQSRNVDLKSFHILNYNISPSVSFDV